MNSTEFTICKAYIDGLVSKLNANRAFLQKSGIPISGSFLSDLNHTLDQEFDKRSGKKLIDHFLADVKRFDGRVVVHTGYPQDNLLGFALSDVFKDRGEVLKAYGKPLPKGFELPTIAMDDDDSVLKTFSLKGMVCIDSLDDDFEEFLIAWDGLGANDNADDLKKQLLEPLLSFS